MEQPVFTGDTAWLKVLNCTQRHGEIWKNEETRETNLPDRAGELYTDKKIEQLRQILEGVPWVGYNEDKPASPVRQFLVAGYVKPFKLSLGEDFVKAVKENGEALLDELKAGRCHEYLHAKCGVKAMNRLIMDGTAKAIKVAHLRCIPLIAEGRPHYRQAMRDAYAIPNMIPLMQANVTYKREVAPTRDSQEMEAIVNAMAAILEDTDEQLWSRNKPFIIDPVRVMACNLSFREHKAIFHATNFLVDCKPTGAQSEEKNQQMLEWRSNLAHMYVKLKRCAQELADDGVASDQQPHLGMISHAKRIENLLLRPDDESTMGAIDAAAQFALHEYTAQLNRAYYEQDLSAYESFKISMIRLGESKLKDYADWLYADRNKLIPEEDRPVKPHWTVVTGYRGPGPSVPQNQPGTSKTTIKKTLSPVVEGTEPQRSASAGQNSDHLMSRSSDGSTHNLMESPKAPEDATSSHKSPQPTIVEEPNQDEGRLPVILDPVATHFDVPQVYSTDEYFQVMLDEGQVTLPPLPPVRVSIHRETFPEPQRVAPTPSPVPPPSTYELPETSEPSTSELPKASEPSTSEAPKTSEPSTSEPSSGGSQDQLTAPPVKKRWFPNPFSKKK